MTVTDPAGAWKTYTSDAFGRLATVQEPNPAGGSYVTTYTYDLLDHLTGVSMPRPSGTQTRTFVYNNTAFLQSATNPESGTVTYTYDSQKRLSTVVDAKNQKKVLTYDSYNRVTQVQRYVYSGGAYVEDPMQRTNFYFDSNPFGTSTYVSGRLAAAQYYGGHCSSYVPSGTQSGCDLIQEWYSYDAPGARLSKTLKITRGTSTGSMKATWTYDTEGRTVKVTYPGGSSCTTCTPSTGSSYTYAYDAMGRPNTLTDTVNTRTLVSGMTYGVANEVQQMTTGYTTGVNSETRTYNGLFQLTQLQVGSSALNIQYAYSGTQNNGKITSQTDVLSGEQITYTYDALNRLATAQTVQTGGTQWGQSYTYDGFGNLTDQTVIKGSAPDVHVAYNYLTNRQTGDTADANGNIGSGYIYDLENRLVQPGSSSTARYGYDAGNKRVWKGDTGVDKITFWAGQKLATYQISTSGGLVYFALTTTRVYFGSKLISTGTYNSAGSGDKVTLTPVAADRLGSIGKFYPYGTERPSATGNDKEKFTGYYRDASTGLDYADQRYEQPGTGRFMTADAAASARGNDPATSNKYAYAGGDPVNRTDPTGQDWYDDYIQSAAFGYTDFAYDQVVAQDSPAPGSMWSTCAPGTALLPSPCAIFWGQVGGPAIQKAPAEQTAPSCSISLFERPVGIPDFGIAEHTYLYLQGPPGILPLFGNETVEGGPDFVNLPIGYLIGITSNPAGNGLDGTNPRAADNHQMGESYTGPQACDDVRLIVNKVSQYNRGANRSIYNAVPEIGPGYNSNSFTYTLLNDIGLSRYFGYIGYFAPGWGGLVPGLQ